MSLGSPAEGPCRQRPAAARRGLCRKQRRAAGFLFVLLPQGQDQGQVRLLFPFHTHVRGGRAGGQPQGQVGAKPKPFRKIAKYS